MQGRSSPAWTAPRALGDVDVPPRMVAHLNSILVFKSVTALGRMLQSSGTQEGHVSAAD